MDLLFSKLEVLFKHLKEQSISIKTDVKISMQIYMDVGVSLLWFITSNIMQH